MSTYGQWRERVFGPGYEVWHEGGPNTAVTNQTWLTERDLTERMLVLGLGENDDAVPVAVEDFVTAGHRPGAAVVAALVVATGDDRPATLRVAASRALWVATRDPESVGRLVGVLRDRRAGETARYRAAIALRDVPPTAELRASFPLGD